MHSMAHLFLVAAFFIFSFFTNAIPLDANAHQSGGEEHIVIIDGTHPAPPDVLEVLNRLELDPNHPDVRWIYNNSAFTGFSASMKSHCITALNNMSDIATVEKAVTVSHAGLRRRNVEAASINTDAPWGLQAISSNYLPVGDTDWWNYTYSYAPGVKPGAGADIYIIDTGIYTQHDAFGGRASMAWSFDNTSYLDLDGHGTHVAGTAASLGFGVASAANIFGIKALGTDGGGISSDVIAGFDFAIQQHENRQKALGTSFVGSVVSMSLAYDGINSAIEQTIAAAAAVGVHVCVAAGNNDQDACAASPAASGGTGGPAISVGAIDIDGARASFSNYGDCVDVYAPGVDIVSTWNTGPRVLNMLDGTSMATPHVTGIVAYLMALNSTLAKDTALMKQAVADSAYVMLNGIHLASNGI